MVTPGQIDRGASISNATVAGVHVLPNCLFAAAHGLMMSVQFTMSSI